jgi:hypothetical protein
MTFTGNVVVRTRGRYERHQGQVQGAGVEAGPGEIHSYVDLCADVIETNHELFGAVGPGRRSGTFLRTNANVDS